MNDDTSSAFQIRDGRTVFISIDEDQEHFIVSDPDGRIIGRFEFCSVEGEHGFHPRLIWAHLDLAGPGYTRQGIGQEIMRRASTYFGSAIEVGSNDGIRQTDGSHLTNEAPPFLEAMKKAGYAWTSADAWDHR